VACPLPLTAPDLGAGYRSMNKAYTTFGGVAPFALASACRILPRSASLRMTCS
jgi:hypothetical protein